MSSSVSSLIVPFIALCVLSVLVDKLAIVLEEVMKKISWLPNEFWGPVAYVIVFVAGLFVCWRGHFDMFTYLGLTFNHSFEGWVLTALLLSGGSKYVMATFGVINSMPQVISNVYSTVTGFLTNDATMSTSDTGSSDSIAPEPTVKEGE